MPVYDSGALMAAERDDRRMWARHRQLLARRVIPVVPLAVLAQTWKGGPRQDRLAMLLDGCDMEVLTPDRARATGTTLAQSRTFDIVDASVVETAIRRRLGVVTSSPSDIETILDALGIRLPVETPS